MLEPKPTMTWWGPTAYRGASPAPFFTYQTTGADGGIGHRTPKIAIMLGAPLGTPDGLGPSLVYTVVSRVRLPLHYVQC